MSKISSLKKFWHGLDHPPTCLDNVFKYTVFFFDVTPKSNSLCPQPAPAEWLMSNVVGKTWHLRQAAASHVLTSAPVMIICCCLLSQFICHISSIQSKVQIIKWIKKYKWPSVWFKHQKILFLMLYRDLPWWMWEQYMLGLIKSQHYKITIIMTTTEAGIQLHNNIE